MIIVKVIGGLGNQMFQIAYAKMLALEFEDDIYLDITSYDKYKIRDFSISNLYISESLKFVEDAKITKINKIFLKSSQKIYHIFQKVSKEFIKIDKFGKKPFKYLTKIGLYYNFDRYYYDDLSENTKIKCLYGYFQSEKYFNKYKNQLVEELKVKEAPTGQEERLLMEINSCNAVGISLRLGDDYLNSTSLNVCSEDFYYRAMDYIYEKNQDVVFYIFSDVIERVNEQFNFKYPVKYVEGFKDYESLRLLYSCKHFIISNSSFSWWGSYLSDNKEKIIIAPDKWNNDSEILPDIFWDGMTLLNV